MTEDPEFVNLDECPIKPALLAGGAVSFVLTLFPLNPWNPTNLRNPRMASCFSFCRPDDKFKR